MDKKTTKKVPAAEKKALVPKQAMLIHGVALMGQMATLTVKITGTDPGDSTVKISLNAVAIQTLHSSGTLSIGNVKSGDIIGVDGSSEGTVDIDIHIPADPTSLNFSPGGFDDEFLIS